MKKYLITATLAMAVVAAPAATAGPLKKDWVAADAQWVIHVDVEGLLDSTIGRFLMDNADAFDIDLDELDDFKQETGLDPRTDLKSVTLYGTGDEPGEDGVLVAVTNDRVDEAIEALLDNEEVPIRKREIDGRTVYVIGDRGDRHYVAIAPAGRNRRIVVMSEDRGTLIDALDVIADDAPSVSMGRSSLPSGDPQDGSLVFVAVGDIEAFGDDHPASEIIRMSDGFTADIGEIDGELVARATVSAESPEVAENISQVLKGMVALGRLMATQNPDLAPIGDLADSLSVRTRDSRITLKLRYDARDLMEKIAELADGDDWDDDEWDEDDDDDDDDRDRRHERKKRKEKKKKRSHD